MRNKCHFYVTQHVYQQQNKGSYCKGLRNICSAVIGTRRVIVDVVDPRKVEMVKQDESSGPSTEVDCAASVRAVLAGSETSLEA